MVKVIAEQLPLFADAAPSICPHCAGLGTLEATDIFCGAGGSSLGLELVCCPSCDSWMLAQAPTSPIIG